MMSARLRQRSCPSAPAFMSVCARVHASCSIAPASMPLDMDVDAVSCKNERRQRRNGPFATHRKPRTQTASSRNAMNL
eukprot:10623133-Lingulodinium_polyedra.AAC.1